ncbi:lysis system i-spanin subunit Rz [Pseudomonas sp. LB3P38]|uniref:lysis system i-spanin subunit Rz n=1 Tax=Pseudomonas lyxosi TaxID=3398358 RepID=UPI0039EF6505
MSPAGLKLALAGVLALLLLTASGVWKVQDWRYDMELADQVRLHSDDLTAINNAATAQVTVEQDKRLALEQRLSTSEQTHYRALIDAQRDQGRLRDRLATADVRLSVLLDADDTAPGCSVPTTSSTGGVDHGAARARLDPAHAQRIIAITDAGDRGLIALQACQAYIRALAR